MLGTFLFVVAARCRAMAVAARRSPGEAAMGGVLLLGTAVMALFPRQSSRALDRPGLAAALLMVVAGLSLLMGHRIGRPWRSPGTQFVLRGLGAPRSRIIGAVLGAHAPELTIGLLVALTFARAVYGAGSVPPALYAWVLTGVAVAGGALAEARATGRTPVRHVAMWALVVAATALTLGGAARVGAGGATLPVLPMLVASAVSASVVAVFALDAALQATDVASVRARGPLGSSSPLSRVPAYLVTIGGRLGMSPEAAGVGWLASTGAVRSKGLLMVGGAIGVVPLVGMLTQIQALSGLVSYLAGFATGFAIGGALLAPVHVTTDIRMVMGNARLLAGWRLDAGDAVLGAVLGSAMTVTFFQVAAVLFAGAVLTAFPPEGAPRDVVGAATIALCVLLLPLASCQYAAVDACLMVSPRLAKTIRGVAGPAQQHFAAQVSFLVTAVVTVAVAVPAAAVGAAGVAIARMIGMPLGLVIVLGACASAFSLLLVASALIQVARRVARSRLQLQTL